MEKDVLIRVSGIQITEGEGAPEPIEVITAGQYFYKGDKHYLRYEEITPDEAGTTKNTVKISPEVVDILKKGASNTHMIFQKDERTVSTYQTPFGNLLLGLDTKDITIEESDSALSVEVRYQLELAGQHVANCHISITANEKDTGEFRI